MTQKSKESGDPPLLVSLCHGRSFNTHKHEPPQQEILTHSHTLTLTRLIHEERKINKKGERDRARSPPLFFFFFFFFVPRAAGWRAAFLFFARLRRAIPPRPALPLLAGRYINRRDPGGVPTRITAPLPARVRKRMGGKAGPLSLSLSASLSLFSVPPFQALSSPSPGSSWRQR